MLAPGVEHGGLVRRCKEERGRQDA